MTKEPKKSDSSTRETNETIQDQSTTPPKTSASAAVSSSGEAALAPHSANNPLKTVGQEVKAHVFSSKGYLKLDYFTLFWLFVAGSVIGLGLETLYHAIVFGGLESRAGLVWGPFSPIYGAGAVILTIFLNRYYHSHNVVIFLIAMVLGSALEYVTSWGMEVFWGAIAWDYTGTFGSIQGRTNFFFGMMWGMLGLLWVRIVLPIVKKVFDHINSKSKFARIVTVLMSIFMAVNIVCTCLALNREKERADNIPATNPIQTFCDTVFPDSFLQTRFENMTVTGSSSKTTASTAAASGSGTAGSTSGSSGSTG